MFNSKENYYPIISLKSAKTYVYLKPIAIDRIGRDIFSDHMPYSFFLLTAGISLHNVNF